MEKQKFTVRVAGRSYTLVSEDPPEFVKRVAALVDRRLSETEAVTNLPSGQAAVLTCFNLTEELLKAVRRAVDSFVKDAEQFDDLTMLCLEYKGKQEG